MATFSFNVTAGESSRILTAFGSALGLKDGSGNQRDATSAEVKSAIIANIVQIVKTAETTVVIPAPIAPT